MIRISRLLIVLVLPMIIAAGCSEPPSGVAVRAAATTTTPTAAPASPSPSPSPTAESFAPEPDKGLPRRPDRIVRALAKVDAALGESIAAWLAEGTPSQGPPPELVVLQALYGQRLSRMMVRRPQLGREVIARLDGALKEKTKSNFFAGRRLRLLVTPVDPDFEFKTGRAEPAGDLLRYYKRAEKRFGVDWEILAAVNMVETRFNKIRSNSSAGAQGPMQFMPATWEAYGMGGDVYDPFDAIMGAANYLDASGAPEDYRKALYAYNHADAYVDAVIAYTNVMRRDPERFFEYYNWQVYVITTEGDKRLTGPGRKH
ncbi:MAG TPA: lytic transglycosylase domain-containing protein [Actinomycetota bacterium]|nr:lytic transglycosylase domain-containing protein [Actinomycetota bacterium]